MLLTKQSRQKADVWTQKVVLHKIARDDNDIRVKTLDLVYLPGIREQEWQKGLIILVLDFQYLAASLHVGMKLMQ